jgi:hypothetical protein
MKAGSQISSYAAELEKNQAAICRLLQSEIDNALPEAASKIWHSTPVWFMGENPVVGYKAGPKHVTLLFWSGQAFDDSALSPVGKFKAAQVRFTEVSEINLKTLRGWLKKSAKEIWDYQGHFKTQRALRKP